MASLSAPITALRQRFSSRKRRGVAGDLDLGDPQVQLEQLGDRLRERRESLDLTMRQLALDTRVSTPVIEALEKAWSDRLPEAAFLRTIIDKLADRLELDADEIVATLQQNLPKQTNRFGRRHGPLTRFTLSSISSPLSSSSALLSRNHAMLVTRGKAEASHRALNISPSSKILWS